MKITDAAGRPITSMEEWATIHNPRHWREGRSAYAVADFILHQDGAAHLESRLAETLGGEVALDAITPEMEVRFDSFGKGRMHDLGVSGTVGRRRLFVGVEAKVDESFGSDLAASYAGSQRRLAQNSSSKGVARIEQLLGRFSPPLALASDGHLRYQLMHGTAGTVAARQGDNRPYDDYVFYVLVFKTGLYDAATGESNYADYRRFIERVGGQELSPLAHRITVDGRELTCIYESVTPGQRLGPKPPTVDAGPRPPENRRSVWQALKAKMGLGLFRKPLP